MDHTEKRLSIEYATNHARRPTVDPTRFDHEKLDVYGVAVDFVAAARTIAGNLSPGQGDIADQLRRAATSITLNIAEGAGEYSRADKARSYRFARRSAHECAAATDLARRLGLLSGPAYDEARQMLTRVVLMLVKITRSLRDSFFRARVRARLRAQSRRMKNATRFSSPC